MNKIIFATAATALLSTAAVAAWTFDAETGVGFVGKGDVQLALGLNNKQVQSATLNFTYADVADTEVYCSKDFEATKTRAAYTNYNSYLRERSITGSVAYDPRVRNQITGFNLMGWKGEPVITGQSVCPGGWDADLEYAAENGVTDGTNIKVLSASGGALKVNGVELATPTL